MPARAAMSYLHRAAGAAAGSGGTPLPAGGAGQPAGPLQGGAAGPSISQQHMNSVGMSGRLAELLDYVKAEFETVSSQAETLRRDNHEYAAHGEFRCIKQVPITVLTIRIYSSCSLLSLPTADMHFSEVSAIRRELTELEREHSRAKQAYEEKIADLKRQLETVRAQLGQGPPIPSVIPANTNHFGALMGHPQGMFGQGGPSADNNRDRERGEMDRERDVKMANGSNGHQSSASAGGPGPGHATASGPGSAAPGYPQHGRPGPPGYNYQQHQLHQQDGPEGGHERDAAYQQLGKRTRPDEPMQDGQPPSAKSRAVDGARPLENGKPSG